MSDVKFHFQSVPMRYVDRVQRSAVLTPLAGPCGEPAKILIKISGLVQGWRARLEQLAAVGWEPVGVDRDRTLRNCQPAFAMVKPKWRCCRCWFCPFCHARSVVPLWRLLCREFPVKENVHHLIERTFRHVVPYTHEGFETQADLLRAIHDQLPTIRRAIVTHQRPVGGLVFFTVEPSQHGWLVKERLLLKVLPTHNVSDRWIETASTFKRYPKPTRQEMLRALSRCYRYPVGIMRSEQLPYVAELLRFRQSARCRMLTTVGSFYGGNDV